jgi:hypothetical protein
MPVRSSDARRVTEHVERLAEFIKEKVWRRLTVLAPPVVDDADLRVCFRSGSDGKAHLR